jgi:ribose transport system ATP-binding protein
VLNARAAQALAHIGTRLEPQTLVQNLTVAEQQIVEIAKGIAADAEVFIFDEPTAALNTADVGRLHTLIREIKAKGKAVLYISHRLEEIFALCDTVTVLKDGAHVATRPTTGLSERELVALMVGRQLSDFFPPRATTIGPMVLDVRKLAFETAPESVSFQLRRGEILGLAGLEGQGQRDITRALAGIVPAKIADVQRSGVNDAMAKIDPGRGIGYLVSQGIGFIPEDRKGEGLFLSRSILENIALGPQSRLAMWQVIPRAKAMVAGLMQSMNIRARNAATRTGALSGGNQQKVLIARWLASGVNILLIEEPTRGVDVGAKAEIYKLLRDFVSKGGAVLTLSRELPELIGLCDRILVVHDRKIVADMAAAETSEHAIIHSAIGTREHGASAPAAA